MAQRIVVIGGGVIGLSAAAACAQRGDEVTVLEAAPAQRGSSLGNAGMIVPSHFVPLAAPGMVSLGLKWMWNPESPFYIKPRLSWDLATWAFQFMRASTPARVAAAAPVLRDLHLASREAYLRLAEEEEFGLTPRGLLMLCKTQHMLDDEARTAEKARELGVPAEVLDARATAVLDPRVTMDITGSVYFPKDCHLQPERYLAVMEKRLAAAGGVLRVARVTGWRREGNRIAAVQTNEGDIARRRVPARRRVMVRGNRPRRRAAAAAAGGKGIQRDTSETRRVAADLRDPRGGSGRGHAHGGRLALWRHDGNRGLE